MSDTKNYSGSCHCGQVRFDVTANLGKVYSRNCSICVKRGALWAFVPPESFALRTGAEALVDYQFNKKVITTCSVANAASDRSRGESLRAARRW
jgi:hypothetical protein